MPELVAWTRTRILQWRIALLWLMVLTAAIAAGARGSPAWTLLIAAALVAQFRLWDDLEDLPYDRVHAPQRALVRSTNLGAFRVVLAASVGLVASAFALLLEWERAGAYLLLLVALAAIYRTTDSRGPRRPLRAQLVVLKYPGFVLLLADQPATPRALAAALALYAALALHERHDQRTGPPQ
jgi:4-hydroxybenzoate polyprenyltransferase